MIRRRRAGQCKILMKMIMNQSIGFGCIWIGNSYKYSIMSSLTHSRSTYWTARKPNPEILLEKILEIGSSSDWARRPMCAYMYCSKTHRKKQKPLGCGQFFDLGATGNSSMSVFSHCECSVHTEKCRNVFPQQFHISSRQNSACPAFCCAPNFLIQSCKKSILSLLGRHTTSVAPNSKRLPIVYGLLESLHFACVQHNWHQSQHVYQWWQTWHVPWKTI